MIISNQYQGSAGETYLARFPEHASPGFGIDFGYFAPYLNPSDHVLDFGCGNGGMLTHLSAVVARVEGLEVNPAAADIARRAGYKVYGGIEELPERCLYHVIISNHVLEHVRDVCATLEALRLHLKPGGLFVTKLPIDDFRAPLQKSWSRDDIDHHLQTWTPRLFANVLHESGFEVQECRVITSAWHHRLFPFAQVGLGGLAFWALAVIKRRRQLLAVGVRKD